MPFVNPIHIIEYISFHLDFLSCGTSRMNYASSFLRNYLKRDLIRFDACLSLKIRSNSIDSTFLRMSINQKYLYWHWFLYIATYFQHTQEYITNLQWTTQESKFVLLHKYICKLKVFKENIFLSFMIYLPVYYLN